MCSQLRVLFMHGHGQARANTAPPASRLGLIIRKLSYTQRQMQRFFFFNDLRGLSRPRLAYAQYGTVSVLSCVAPCKCK